MRPTAHILVVNGTKVRHPVFVLGSPHSGADLVARALKRTAGFHLTLGRTNVLRVVYAFARRPSLSQGKGAAAARVLRDAFAEAWQLTPHACLGCAAACRDAAGVAGVGPCVAGREVTRYGDASPDLLYSATVLLDAFPDARLVQVIRDGRDAVTGILGDGTALAWFKPSFANIESEFPNPFFGIENAQERTSWPELSLAAKAALRWRGSVRLSARLHADIDADRLLTLRYEDVVRTPRNAARMLSRFLDTAVPAIPLEARRLGIGAWRDRLDPEQVDDIRAVAGDELRRLGYE